MNCPQDSQTSNVHLHSIILLHRLPTQEKSLLCFLSQHTTPSFINTRSKWETSGLYPTNGYHMGLHVLPSGQSIPAVHIRILFRLKKIEKTPCELHGSFTILVYCGSISIEASIPKDVSRRVKPPIKRGW